MTLTLSHPRPQMELAQAGVKIGNDITADDVPLAVAELIAFLIVSIRAQVVVVTVASFIEVCGEIWAVVGEPVERGVRGKLSAYVELSV